MRGMSRLSAHRAFLACGSAIAILFLGVFSFAVAQEDVDGNTLCPDDNFYVYISTMALNAKTPDGKINLYGKLCVSIEAEDKAAEGKCVGRKQCEARLCDGEPCKLTPLTIDGVNQAVYGGDTVKLDPAQSLTNPNDTRSVFDSALFDPTPIKDQTGTMSPSSAAIQEQLQKSIDSESGGWVSNAKTAVSEKWNSFFSPEPLAEGKVELSGGSSGEASPVTLTDESGFKSESTFGETISTESSTDTACDSWISCMRERISSLYQPEDLETAASRRKLESNWNFGNMAVCSRGRCSGFQSFDTPQEGAKADMNNVMRWIENGDDTLNKLMTRLSPPHENDTAGMVRYLSNQMGVGPNERLDPANPAQMVQLFDNKTFLEWSTRASEVMEPRDIVSAYKEVALSRGIEPYYGGAQASVSESAPTAVNPVEVNPRLGAEGTLTPTIDASRDINYSGIAATIPVMQGEDLPDITPLVNRYPTAEWNPYEYPSNDVLREDVALGDGAIEYSVGQDTLSEDNRRFAESNFTLAEWHPYGAYDFPSNDDVREDVALSDGAIEYAVGQETLSEDNVRYAEELQIQRDQESALADRLRAAEAESNAYVDRELANIPLPPISEDPYPTIPVQSADLPRIDTGEGDVDFIDEGRTIPVETRPLDTIQNAESIAERERIAEQGAANTRSTFASAGEKISGWYQSAYESVKGAFTTGPADVTEGTLSDIPTVPVGEDVPVVSATPRDTSLDGLAIEYPASQDDARPEVVTAARETYIDSQIPVPDIVQPTAEEIMADIRGSIAASEPSFLTRVQTGWNNLFGSTEAGGKSVPLDGPVAEPSGTDMQPQTTIPYFRPRLTTAELLGIPEPLPASWTIPVTSADLPPARDTSLDSFAIEYPGNEQQVRSDVASALDPYNQVGAIEYPGSQNDARPEVVTAARETYIDSRIPVPDIVQPTAQEIMRDIRGSIAADKPSFWSRVQTGWNNLFGSNDPPRDTSLDGLAIEFSGNESIRPDVANALDPYNPVSGIEYPANQQEIRPDIANTFDVNSPPDAFEYPSNDPLRPDVADERSAVDLAGAIEYPSNDSVRTDVRTEVKTETKIKTEQTPTDADPSPSVFDRISSSIYRLPSSVWRTLGQAMGQMFFGNNQTAQQSSQGTNSAGTTPTTQTSPTTTTSGARPVVSLIANPSSVEMGGTSALAWASIGTVGCNIYAPQRVQIATGTPDGRVQTARLATTSVFVAECSTAFQEKVYATTTVIVK